METQQLSELLTDAFPGSTPELEKVSSGRNGGFLIWSGFQEMDQLERQRSLWNVLRGHLSRDELQQVTTILTLTPDELAVMRS